MDIEIYGCKFSRYIDNRCGYIDVDIETQRCNRRLRYIDRCRYSGYRDIWM